MTRKSGQKLGGDGLSQRENVTPVPTWGGEDHKPTKTPRQKTTKNQDGKEASADSRKCPVRRGEDRAEERDADRWGSLYS